MRSQLLFRRKAANSRHVLNKARLSGFSFIELIITAAIMAVLATMAMPMIELSVQHTREQELRANLRQIREAIDAYKKAWDEDKIKKPDELDDTESGYPNSLESLANGVLDATDPDERRLIYFLRRIPPDPMFQGPRDTPPAQTWGKRSYASPAEAPQEGKDIFDVYSMSKGIGLNGVPYAAW